MLADGELKVYIEMINNTRPLSIRRMAEEATMCSGLSPADERNVDNSSLRSGSAKFFK